VVIVDFFDGQVISEQTECSIDINVNEIPDAEISSANDPDCQDATGSYSVQSGEGFTYQWVISGNAQIVGSATDDTVSILADNSCNVDFDLSVTVSNNGCISSDSIHREFADSIAPVIGSAGDDEVVLCTEEYAFDPPSATDN